MPVSKRSKKSKDRQSRRVEDIKLFARQQKNLFRKQMEEHQSKLESEAKNKVDELHEQELVQE